MYNAGLYAVPEAELFNELARAGKQIRQKDIDNYHRGLDKSYFTDTSTTPASDPRRSFRINANNQNNTFTNVRLSDLPRSNQLHDYERRWVPCNADNKPMVRWSENLMTREEAKEYPGSVYLAESMVNTPFIVFDIDGDHDDVLHLDLINTFYEMIYQTHALCKTRTVESCIMSDSSEYIPLWDAPTSFHLTFYTDRIIPTKHFTNACIDLLGNQRNQLRYRKTKVWNGVYPVKLTEEIWHEFMRYIEMMNRRAMSITEKGTSNAYRNLW